MLKGKTSFDQKKKNMKNLLREKLWFANEKFEVNLTNLNLNPRSSLFRRSIYRCK